ncbi:hypothetical protein V8F20_008715, partial [Naviculisporaceae sp. PSN 640]
MELDFFLIFLSSSLFSFARTEVVGPRLNSKLQPPHLIFVYISHFISSRTLLTRHSLSIAPNQLLFTRPVHIYVRRVDVYH